MDFEDVHSSTSSSSLSTTAPSMINASNDHKKRAGREKTRHPFYRGVRRRRSGKWVSEIREPNKKSRIWLGTFPCPEMAAVAHDVAALALHGDMAVLNFPDSAHRLPRPASSSHQDLQRAARQAAMDFTPVSSSSTSLTFSENASKKCIVKYLSTCLDSQNNVLADPSSGSNSFHAKDDQTKINVGTPCSSRVEFVDEEAVFNMPLLLDSMAEGMLLTPPAMRKGFSWSHEVDDDMDLTLWED